MIKPGNCAKQERVDAMISRAILQLTSESTSTKAWEFCKPAFSETCHQPPISARGTSGPEPSRFLTLDRRRRRLAENRPKRDAGRGTVLELRRGFKARDEPAADLFGDLTRRCFRQLGEVLQAKWVSQFPPMALDEEAGGNA